MVAAIGDTLPLALGVAFSPVPIIAVILILLGRCGNRNGYLFVLGWPVGVVLLSALVILLASGFDGSSGNGQSLILPLVKLFFGSLLLYMALRSWRRRPKPGEEPVMPAWMEKLDQFGPSKAFGLGTMMGTLNIKNLPVTVAAASLFAHAGLGARQTIVSVAAYAFVATLGVAFPVALVWFGGNKAKSILTDWKEWLSENNATILFVLFLFLGLSAIGKGLGGLVAY